MTTPSLDTSSLAGIDNMSSMSSGDGATAGAKCKNAPGKSSGSGNGRLRIDNLIDDPTLLSMPSKSPPPPPPPLVDKLLLPLVLPPPAPPVDNLPPPEPETQEDSEPPDLFHSRACPVLSRPHGSFLGMTGSLGIYGQ
ncbi:hypothetical protein DFH08DRAFT_1085442 [Mycena albidolilacea]|uniref:Uncharacterized protein n=1 Tax=Mycena albidolilacea TaxID=1033008 RepID=A0AAD6ZHW2_9AGAR|nr:hypothetical protein DFH08DRAFT_1085442 [Mycena albidolilacea]